MGFYQKPVFGGVSANDVHISRTRIIKSAPAEEKSKSDKSYRFTKNTILTVIAFTMLIIVGFTIFNLIATPEFMVKRKMESIANDYYQNYFYNSVPDKEGLSHYTETGLSRLSLRQLLLYSDRKYGDTMDFFTNYCDLDKTTLKFYPEEPFERNTYYVDFRYSCKF